jgi:hypothetical protein
MYDNLKNVTGLIFGFGVIEALTGVVHVWWFRDIMLVPETSHIMTAINCEMIAAATMLLWSIMMAWVIQDTPDDEEFE